MQAKKYKDLYATAQIGVGLGMITKDDIPSSMMNSILNDLRVAGEQLNNTAGDDNDAGDDNIAGDDNDARDDSDAGDDSDASADADEDLDDVPNELDGQLFGDTDGDDGDGGDMDGWEMDEDGGDEDGVDAAPTQALPLHLLDA